MRSRPLMVRPELLKLDLSAKTYLITGANSGVGLVTARQLASQGARVVLACRRPDEGQRAASAIESENSRARVEVIPLDLGSLASVRSCAAAFLESHDELHGLVNNAGVMNTPKGKTQDGFETQFGVNHLGHFLLTELLLDVLKQSAPSRVVNLSSSYHDVAMGRRGDIHFDDLNYETRKYDGWEAYAQSKLANLLHAKELAKRLEGTFVTAVSVHPGWVRTNLIRNSLPVWLQDTLLRPFLRMAGMIEPWEGAQSTLHALLAPEVTEYPGAFFSQAGGSRDGEAARGGWPLRSPNPAAHDDAKAVRLGQVSRELVGL